MSYAEGSSPRMRGAPFALMWWAARYGIIPAYAGSTVYPDVVKALLGGSSPRMRGAPVEIGVITAASGIIPAYAGSTIPGVITGPHLEDHPRVCGEHESASSG